MESRGNRDAGVVGVGSGLRRYAIAAGAIVSGAWGTAGAQQNLHVTYLWHLEQPIYWPDRQASGADRYERAWESIQRTDAGAAHPSNNLRDIFGLADRVNAYQWRCRDSINAFSSGRPEAGAQISYSGGLIENIASLGGANQLGYSGSWHSSLREARGWSTFSGPAHPRADIVVFPFHHALMPLIGESAMRREVQVYQEVYADAWGAGVARSRGFFPSEMAFSTRMIPVLASLGVEWSIVSAEKVSRACADFPVVLGTGGINCDPPNRADQVNPSQTAAGYYRKTISRGCSPAEAYPFALTPHRARYVDPATGAVSSIVVVPSSQHLSWEDGYSPQGIADFQALNTRNDPSRPMLVVLAHDGDNAWGGGYSYYMEATPNRVAQAASAGFVPTVVERYLADHPVPAGDYAHVEDGAWVNADGDFGSPQFLNWNWPPVSASGQVDIAGGWAEDIRNWAVITAAQNRVDTAEQIWTDPPGAGGQGGTVSVRKILYPDASTNGVERAWHYFLGALNSGYMYYGTAEDFEVKPAVACNEAARLADPIIAASPAADRTGPTIWIPQRYPWNPGSTNFGPLHAYQAVTGDPDFWVWTFVADASGVASATLMYRVDADGARSLANHENETYAGGPGVGAWQGVAMTRRAFPAGNVYNNPTINFFEMPAHVAEQFHARVVGVRDALVDYYVESVDARGNITRSPIQHVYVGAGSTGGGGPVVEVRPALPTAGQQATVVYDPAGRVLAGAGTTTMHWGVNNWTQVTDTPMAQGAGPDAGKWVVTVTLPASATQLDCVFNGAPSAPNTWDNNSGQDWHFAVQPGGPPPPSWTIDGVRDADSVLVAANGGMSLWAGLKGDDLYVACNDAGEGNDHFIFVAAEGGAGALRAAPWAKAGQAASWRCFLADENNNDFEGWFDHGAARAQAATTTNANVLEGTVNLADLFGATPGAVHLAVGVYATNDGGALVASAQVPTAVVANGTIEANEFARVDLCAIGPTRPAFCCIADVDDGGGSGTPDGAVDISDLLYFLALFDAGDSEADVDDGSSTGTPDGGVDISDLLYFLLRFDAGC